MLFSAGQFSLKLMACVGIMSICTMEGVGGNEKSPEYYIVPRLCDQDEDCHQTVGEVCQQSYKGCPQGQCACDTSQTFSDGSSTCKTKKMGEGECDSDGQCPATMRCHFGRCHCEQGRMTPERNYCFRDEDRLLGQPCHPYHHTCLQMSGTYTSADVECIASQCQCVEGYRRDGALCRRWKIKEYGCSKDHQCQGGALCVDGRCLCPSGYLAVAGNTKCAKYGSTAALSIGEICNEIGEKSYCAEGLVCHKCIGQSKYVCVQYSESSSSEQVSSAYIIGPQLPQYLLQHFLLGIAYTQIFR